MGEVADSPIRRLAVSLLSLLQLLNPAQVSISFGCLPDAALALLAFA
jgi:hypothetical protein